MPIVSAVVEVCDHYLPSGKSPDLHEFHVIVRIEETGERVRLRTDRGNPLKLSNFQPMTVPPGTFPVSLEEIVDMFEVGRRLRFMRGSVPRSRRLTELGFDPSDITVNPREIEVLRGTPPRPHFGVSEGGPLSRVTAHA